MKFIARSVIRATPQQLFAFHELQDAFERLMPPWEKALIIERAKTLEPGARAVVVVRIAGLVPVRIESVHTHYDPPHSFEDQQVRGPFRKWHHRHIVEPHPEGATLVDEIDYEPPLGILGRLFAPLFIKRRLQRIFAYRHQVTRDYFERATSAGGGQP